MSLIGSPSPAILLAIVVSPVSAGFLMLASLSVAISVLMHLVVRDFITACLAAAVLVSVVFHYMASRHWPSVFPMAWFTGALIGLLVAMLVGLGFYLLRPLPARRGAGAAPTAKTRQAEVVRQMAPPPAAYHLLYIFRVPTVKVAEFLRIQREAAALYTSHGAVGSETYRVLDDSGKFSLIPFATVFPPALDENLFIGIDSYRDRAHHREVAPRIQADPRLADLYRSLTEVLEINRVVYAELESSPQTR